MDLEAWEDPPISSVLSVISYKLSLASRIFQWLHPAQSEQETIHRFNQPINVYLVECTSHNIATCM